MFFSDTKWKEGEANDIIPKSQALGLNKVRGSLLAADDVFLTPLFGEELMDVFAEVYAKDTDAQTAVEKKLIRSLQVAELNLAFFHDFQELSLRITDQGFQRQTTENYAGVYKYQEDALRQSFRNKGLNALDRILEILEANADAFPAYHTSPAWLDTRKRVVRNAAEVNAVCFIHGSQLVFRRLLPLLRKIEDTQLPNLLGTELYRRLMAAIAEGNESQQVGSTTFGELRMRCVQYLVYKACAQLVRESGSLTDRGLYFESIAASGEGNESKTPADADRAARLAMTYEASALDYSSALTTFVEFYIPDLFGGHVSDVLRRDNDGKRTVWL